MGLDTQIERRGDLSMNKVELEQQPGIMTEEEEVTSGEEEQMPDLEEKPRFKARKSLDTASQQGEKTTTTANQIKKKFSILSFVEFDPVTTAPASPTSSTSSTMATTFLNMESLLATDLLQRKLSMMSMSKLKATIKSDEQEEAQQSEK